ncbi:MAG: cytochrome c [Alphaproteobacteria bacterium]|nr:cytochrome c [Alphaproteobacteria bacterium]
MNGADIVRHRPATLAFWARSAPLAACLLAMSPAAAAAADAEQGKAVFQACTACHNDAGNALGPSLKAVFGRKSAALEDYRYSPAMTRANMVWDEANLRSFIANPQAKVKGNRMPFGGITVEKDLDDVVAFLKTYK